jgi:hypothetical protein
MLLTLSLTGKLHRSGTINPKLHRLRRLPFIFAHKLLICARRPPPVNRAQSIACLCRAELPKDIPRPGAPPPVPAQ